MAHNSLKVIERYIRETEKLGKGETELKLMVESEGGPTWIVYFWLTDSRFSRDYYPFKSYGKTIEEALARMAKEIEIVEQM